MPQDFRFVVFPSHNSEHRTTVRAVSLSASIWERAGARCREIAISQFPILNFASLSPHRPLPLAYGSRTADRMRDVGKKRFPAERAGVKRRISVHSGPPLQRTFVKVSTSC